MDLKLKCLPFGTLPYKDEKLATRMILRLFEKSPFLPLFPLVSDSENIIDRTIENLPGIKKAKKGPKNVLKFESAFFPASAEKMDYAYNNIGKESLEEYGSKSFYLEKFFQIVDRVKPHEAIISFLGPFSLAQMIINEDNVHFLSDKYYRKYFIQCLTLKAMWFVKKVKSLSIKTTPLIIFEEPKLNEFGVISKSNPSVTRDVVTVMFSKIIQVLHAEGAAVCIQCFNKCDWQIPIDAGVDMISFNAYDNPSNLTVIPDKINEFLLRGGYINWAIVPVKSESIVKTLGVDDLLVRLNNTIQGVINSGVPRHIIFKRNLVSIQGDISMLPLLFAEKALMVEAQLSTRMAR